MSNSTTQSLLSLLPVQNLLADTPTQSPQYATRVLIRQNDHRSLEIEVADPDFIRALVALMDMSATLGGAASHFGGPAAFAELSAVIHGYAFYEGQKKSCPWHQLFHIVNDAGHCENGIYALKAMYGFAGLDLNALKKFRSLSSPLTGHGEVHMFPEGVWISNGPLGSGLPQAQGLAFADHLKGLDRITVVTISDGACFEGEAKEAFAAIPGLAKKGRLAPFICILSDNNTKLSGRIDSDSYSLNGFFESLGPLGWKVLHLPQGNKIQDCMDTFTQAVDRVRAQPDQPVLIWAKTIKGYGSAETANSKTGAHGFHLTDAKKLPGFLAELLKNRLFPQEIKSWCDELIAAQCPIPSSISSPIPSPIPSKSDNPSTFVVREKIQVGISKALIQAKKNGLPIVSVSADLQGSTGAAKYQAEYPQFSLDLGVAESNMVSTAIGLSKAGFIPIVDTFAQFGTTKGALPLIMAGLSQGPVIAIYSHTGFQDAADGASHQSLSYFAMSSSIPHVRIYCLTCSAEADALLTQVLVEFGEARRQNRVPPSSLFFLGRENYPQYYPTARFINGVSKFHGPPEYKLGYAQILFDNTDQFSNNICLVAAGSLLDHALQAAHGLCEQSVGCIVINPSIINTPDVKTLAVTLGKTQGHLLTIEDHNVVGGMGALLAHALSLHGVPFRMRSMGISDFGQSAYLADHLYRQRGLDAQSIIQQVLIIFQSGRRGPS